VFVFAIYSSYFGTSDCVKFKSLSMTSLKIRLVLMSFLQFFIWGAWLLTIGAYWFQTKQW